ncbi:MAG: nucleoside-diphosphate-sugar epimerase [Algoriphagus sp.]|jgi:nucleoside-diphosphate-sugar epimerase
MKFLVTGANGFIGSHLVDSLQDQGHGIFKITSENGGVLDDKNYEQFLEKEIDVVVHLAGKTFVPESWEKPADYLNHNVNGTINSLEFCRNTKSKLIYISSYMYGSPDYLPIDEKHPIKVFNPYGLSKRIAEEVCEFYRNNFGMNVVIMRPFNIYGLGQNLNFIIPFILDQLINGSEVKVKDLEPKRDYLFIRDFIDSILSVSDEKVKTGTFNIGSGVSYSVQEIIDEAQQILGTNFPISQTGERRENEVMDVVADISCLKQERNWTPKHSLKEGLAACIDSLKKSSPHPNNGG